MMKKYLAKVFHIGERGQGQVWSVGARSTLTLFRSGVHFGVRGCTLPNQIEA